MPSPEYQTTAESYKVYFRIDDARRSGIGCQYVLPQSIGESCDLLRSSDFLAFSSLTRLAKIWAYSFCSITHQLLSFVSSLRLK